MSALKKKTISDNRQMTFWRHLMPFSFSEKTKIPSSINQINLFALLFLQSYFCIFFFLYSLVFLLHLVLMPFCHINNWIALLLKGALQISLPLSALPVDNESVKHLLWKALHTGTGALLWLIRPLVSLKLGGGLLRSMWGHKTLCLIK